MKNRIFWFAGGLLLLSLLCAGVAGWFFLRSDSQGTRAVVQIKAPTSAGLSGVNETLPLVVYAEASRPVLRLEVYADGALVAAANGDRHALTLTQNWTPSTPGRHVLLARAFFAADDFADSQAVFVDTADLSNVPVQISVDSLSRGEGVSDILVRDLAEAAGVTSEEISSLNPGLPAAPDAVIPPGTSVTIPRRTAPAPGAAPAIPPPAPGAPGSPASSAANPRFDGETHTCSQISIRWTDAPDETAYRLYRIAPGGDRMELLATQPANTITYADSFITGPGTYRYFLAPIRPGGESISSMLGVEIPADCTPSGTGASTSLRLLLLNLTTQEAYNGVYCYVSINGSRYERIPSEPGLLLPTNGDLSYDLPLQLPNRGIYSVNVPTDGLMRLDGECWGRRGVESIRIGRFSGSHASPEWDGRDLINEVLAFEPRELVSLDGHPVSAGGASFLRYRIQPTGSRFDLSGIAPGALQSVYLNIPAILDPLEGTDTSIPSPTNLRIANVAGCDVFPSADPNVESSICNGPLMPLLRWDWQANSFYNEADVLGWRINLIIVMDDLRPGSLSYPGPSTLVVRPVGAASAGRSAGLPALPSNISCGVNVRITVTTLTARGASLPSEAIFLRQPPCPDLGMIRITFNSITVGPSARIGELRDDGDICVACTDRRMEIFGDIFIGMNDYAPTFRNDPSHGAGTILFGSCPNSTACLNQGRYQWGSRPHIAPWLSEMEIQAATLGSRGEITLTAVLKDYDTQNGPDNFCIATYTLQPRSNAEWTRLNETVVLRSDLGEASCEVEILVQGIPGPSAP